jgi:hypothetical protein
MRTQLARLALLVAAVSWLTSADPLRAQGFFNCECSGYASGWRFVLMDPYCGSTYTGPITLSASDDYGCYNACDYLVHGGHYVECSQADCSDDWYPSQTSDHGSWYNTDTGHGDNWNHYTWYC